MDPGVVILTLKIAVVLVTILLACSLTAIMLGHVRLHGRINLVFFALTLTALLGLEVVIRMLDKDGLFTAFLRDRDATRLLEVHLWFAMPSAALLFVMLFTGLRHYRKLHVGMGLVFLVLWTGTFVTGVFWLPHQ
jgi:uncharacterized membrane protein YozB (DUF420 family)